MLLSAEEARRITKPEPKPKPKVPTRWQRFLLHCACKQIRRAALKGHKEFNLLDDPFITFSSFDNARWVVSELAKLGYRNNYGWIIRW